jgi:hypothetical protein
MPERADFSEIMRTRVAGRKVAGAMLLGKGIDDWPGHLRLAVADGYVAVAEDDDAVLLQRFET